MFRYLLQALLFSLILAIFCNCTEKGDVVDFKKKMLEEINSKRLNGCFCGEDSMPPVQELLYDESLEFAAQRHVHDMTENNFLSHIGSDGSTPSNRAADAGFMGAYIGENIARGFISVDEVMSRWFSSTEHCKTMMDPYYSFMGIAYEEYYWVQLFGSN